MDDKEKQKVETINRSVARCNKVIRDLEQQKAGIDHEIEEIQAIREDLVKLLPLTDRVHRLFD